MRFSIIEFIMAIIKLGLISSLLALIFLAVDGTSRGFLVSHSQQLLARRWRNYKEKYDLQFHPSDEITRLAIYRKNLEFIHFFNEEDHEYKLAENQFAHWTHEEYMIWLEESNKMKIETEQTVPLQEDILKMGIADRDWRSLGKVTPVKNQGTCGSCYSFATSAAVESVIAIATGSLVDLSPQDIVDCSGSYGNLGCNGGYITRTFLYYRDVGVVPLSYYPYTGRAGTCVRPNMTTIVPAKVSRYVSLTPNDEVALATAISNLNPVTVAVDASLQTFQFYSSGVYYDASCSTTAVNHAVTAVGIGSSPSEHYIIKNSWGTSWGSQGYILLARNKRNACGVAKAPAYPVK